MKKSTKTVYIPCIRVIDKKTHTEEHWAQTVNESGKEAGLTASGRWTDGAKYSRSDSARKQAKIIADRWKDSFDTKGVKVESYVRAVHGVESGTKTVGQMRKKK